MGYQVEVIEQQVHQKSWFNRFKTKWVPVVVTAGTLAIAESSQAFMTGADVTGATGSAGGEDVLKQVGIWVLTIAVGISVVIKVVSLVKK